MIKENNNLCKTNELNHLYEKAAKEDFFGENMHILIEKCKLCLYYYPLQLKLLKEDTISDFFIINQVKIRNTICNFNCSNIPFKTYYLNYIKICVKYYKLKINHDYLYNNIILEVLVKNSDSFEKETIFEDNSKIPTTIAKYKYKTVEEDQNFYIENISELNSNDNFQDLYNEIVYKKNDDQYCQKYQFLNELKNKLNKKSTRKNILLLLLTMPDAILDNYVEEVSYIFSIEEKKVITIFNFSSELLIAKKTRFEKYSNLNNKHYKNYLLNNYKLTSQFYNKSIIQTSINWDKKAMDKNAQKIRKTLNMHVSQRTLARELNINKGTVASSISAAKKLLSEKIKTS